MWGFSEAISKILKMVESNKKKKIIAKSGNSIVLADKTSVTFELLNLLSTYSAPFL